jgi:hypothetical protein
VVDSKADANGVPFPSMLGLFSPSAFAETS